MVSDVFGGRLRQRLERRTRRRCLKGQRHSECGTGTGCARCGDIAAHDPRQSSNDGKAQPGPSELPGGRAIGLDKRLEQACELLLAEPDAAVRDGENRARAAVT